MTDYSLYHGKAGIYKLTCKNNNKIYIGKSINIGTRLSYHKNTNGKTLIRKAIEKHGWDSFDVEILEIFENFNKLKDNDHLLKREAHFIEILNSTDRDIGYNLCKFSRDTTGTVRSKETKEKIRQAMTGRKHSEETKEKLKHINLGKKLSEETKEKMRQRMLGNTHGTKLKGIKKISEENKEKLRIRLQGNTYAKGHKITEEHKEKLRIANIKKNQMRLESKNDNKN
jgi:group I intron endonuclease